MIFLLLCILPVIVAEDNATTLHVLSGDLPEDYHVGTIAPEMINVSATTVREDAQDSVVVTTTEIVNSNASDTAVSRSFIIDASDPEFNTDSTESTTLKPETTTTTAKPQKLKKKMLIVRPRTDKPIVESPANQTDLENEENVFYSYSSTTTEVSDGRQITNSVLITGIDNNNLLNVVETSVRPAAKNTLLGQTDWVPLVSKKPTSRIRFPDTDDDDGDASSTTEMDVAVWALASSQLTRSPANASEQFVNNTVVKNTETNAGSRVGGKPAVDNVTREPNQVLINTIPDSVVVETTPTSSKWRPVVTVTPSAKPLTGNVSEDAADVERTMAFEIMKITTTVSPVSAEERLEENQVVPSSEKPATHAPILLKLLDATTKVTENTTDTSEQPKSTEKVPEKVENVSVEVAETTTVETITETEANTEILKTTEEDNLVTTTFEPPVADGETTEREKTDDENRTILTNETTVIDRPLLDEITEENVPAYLRLTVQTSEIELCHLLPDLRTSILKILSEGTNSTVSSDSLVLLNLNPTICKPVLTEERAKDLQVRHRPVNMFLMDENGDFNKNLSEAFLRLWGEAGLDFPLPILKVDFVTPIPEGELEPDMSSGVIAAIVISCVAGLCLILLGLLFVVMKRRQKKFNYGQRCTPVSLDAYSLDSVSIRHSSRRKGIRASKRSYGNAAFDDSEVPSHPVNFAGLANFSLEKEQLHQEFSVIPQVAPRPDELPPGAESRNRYANVIPLPETRVVLSLRDGEPHSDYINANFVKGLSCSENLYIAAQAPLDNTLADWWRMVWEQQVKVILMLTALQENGVEKCADYLPPNEVTDNLRLFGDYQVTLKKRDVKDKYILSTLQLKNMENNLWREVTHLWYVGWPDSGVPSEPNSLIAFLIEARSQLKSTSGTPAPTLVHCSPGTGRTGTVIVCDMLIREFEQKRLVDIPRAVYHLRRSRAGAVQTRDQYAFIYQVLNTYATKLTGGALETI